MDHRGVIALDPGLTTGVAYSDWRRNLHLDQWTDPTKILELFSASPLLKWRVVIEKYNSSGRITKEAKHTLELVGYFTGVAEANGFEVIKHSPQERIHKVPLAEEIVKSRGITKKFPHGTDALAHWLYYTGITPTE